MSTPSTPRGGGPWRTAGRTGAGRKASGGPSGAAELAAPRAAKRKEREFEGCFFFGAWTLEDSLAGDLAARFRVLICGATNLKPFS